MGSNFFFMRKHQGISLEKISHNKLIVQIVGVEEYPLFTLKNL